LAYLLRKLSNDLVGVLQPHHSKRSQLLIPNLSPGRDEGWDFTYYTSTIGVDTAHSKEKFYRKVCTIYFQPPLPPFFSPEMLLITKLFC
jgi:hypothetical protein